MEMNMSSDRRGMCRRDFVRVGLGAMAAPVLLGCGSSPTGPGSGSPRLSARPGSPGITPTLGRSDLGLHDDRDGFLYVPQSYSAQFSWPLFVALHGAGSSGSWWQSYIAPAEDRGMILLAPDSRASTWDLALGGFGADVAFLDRALRHTFERVRIDTERIALGGFSDGASYALSLGVSNGDLFSHLAAYSPGFFSPSDPIIGGPRVYVSHGTRDTILPVALSRDVIVPSLRQAGYDVTYAEFDGGHSVPAGVVEESLSWFLAGASGS